MSEFKINMVDKLNNDPTWLLLEKMYEKNYQHNADKTERLPKKIHQVWLGGKIPEKSAKLQSSWINKNPNWEYKLWTDDDVKDFGLENIDAFNATKNLGSKSDIFRYEILKRYGGLYIDTDFECIKSFDDLTNLEFFTGTGHISIPEVFNGLIASVPNHPIINTLIENIKTNNDFSKISFTTGPMYFSNIFFNYIKNNNDNIVVFPTKFFYPFPAVYRHSITNYNDKEKAFVMKFNNNNSYATHLWYTSWQKIT